MFRFRRLVRFSFECAITAAAARIEAELYKAEILFGKNNCLSAGLGTFDTGKYEQTKNVERADRVLGGGVDTEAGWKMVHEYQVTAWLQSSRDPLAGADRMSRFFGLMRFIEEEQNGDDR